MINLDIIRDQLLSIKGDMDTLEVEIAQIQASDPTDLGTLEILEIELETLENEWAEVNQSYLNGVSGS